MNLSEIYEKLLERYGKQNWWPAISKNPEERRFEISIGAILTQNTAWKNVEKAIQNLNKTRLLAPEKILKIKIKKLAELIKPAGYYNQKAASLKILAGFFLKKARQNQVPARQELLELKGIGPETADSILLYAYNQPFFVVDAYTKRFFNCIKINFNTYGEWQEFFHKNLPKNPEIYNEFHALIVQHCKNICKKKPDCETCFLNRKIN